MQNHCYTQMNNHDQLVKAATLARLETDVLLYVTKSILGKNKNLTFKCSANHANCIGCYKPIEQRILLKFRPAA